MALLWALSLAALILAAARPASAAELERWRGGPTPPLAQPLLDGGRFDLAAMRGKVVLVNFWATWCAPCIKEMPAIERLAQRLPAEGFAVVAVNYGESEERIRAFLRRVPIALPIALDGDFRAARAWGAKALPISFVVDGRGRIRLTALGDLDWSTDGVVAALRRLMDEAGGTSTGTRAGVAVEEAEALSCAWVRPVACMRRRADPGTLLAETASPAQP